jgi:hypothetical protein
MEHAPRVDAVEATGGERELLGVRLHNLTVEALKLEAAPNELRALGSLLCDHVRIEERELFDEIERVVPAAELERLAGNSLRRL